MTAAALPETRRAEGPRVARGARVAWITVGLVLALAGTGIVVSRTIVREFDTSYATIPPTARVYHDPVHRLVVFVTAGAVTIVPGPASTTTVDTTGTRSSVMPSDDEHLIGTTLYLRSDCGPPPGNGNFCTRDYRVQVPASVSVTATVGTGDLDVADIHGALDATVGTGNVFVTNDVGSVTVATGFGNVVVRRQDGPLRATTQTGDVVLTGERGPAQLVTGNGNVSVAGASTSLRITTATGNVAATGLTGSTFSATVGNGGVEAAFTAAPREVDVTTQTGAVSLHVPYGDVRYQLHLRSPTGRVVSGIPSDPSSTRVIRVVAGNGDVVVGVGAVVSTPPSTPSTSTTTTTATAKPAPNAPAAPKAPSG